MKPYLTKFMKNAAVPRVQMVMDVSAPKSPVVIASWIKSVSSSMLRTGNEAIRLNFASHLVMMRPLKPVWMANLPFRSTTASSSNPNSCASCSIESKSSVNTNSKVPLWAKSIRIFVKTFKTQPWTFARISLIKIGTEEPLWTDYHWSRAIWVVLCLVMPEKISFKSRSTSTLFMLRNSFGVKSNPWSGLWQI